MSQSIISFKNVTKSFPKATTSTLSNISFDVQSGTIFGLIGLNGIGKTTLIKCLLNIYTQYDGVILMNGIDARNEESRTSVYYLPEKFAPSASLTGFDFVKIVSPESLINSGLSDQVLQYAELLNFDAKALNRRISTYSKGMTQKVALIGAFASNPKIMILDEPMSGLDPQARVLLKRAMREYMKDKDNVIFFSSHILSDIHEICDSVCLVHNGERKFYGKPHEMIKDGLSFEESFLKYIF